MDWIKLITNKRLGQECRHCERHDDRTEFKRDYDRLIFSAPFRRLQNKTQVFPLPGSIFVHNRLTHSLEVASVGMSLGNDVASRIIAENPHFNDTMLPEIGTIVSTACLAHDMGNPPFGHSGEKAIQAFFTEGGGRKLRNMVSPEIWADITHFEGNANAFRLLAHRYKGRRDGGFVMTYTTLASIVKYPVSSTCAGKKGKFGFFHEELPVYQKIASELGIPQMPADKESGNGEKENVSGVAYARHPLVYLVEAADDICYEVMDIEDAHKLKILSFEETSELLLGFFNDKTREKIKRRIKDEGITDDNEKVVYMRARVIGLLEKCCVDTFLNNKEKIMEGTFKGSLIDEIDEKQRLAYKICTETSRRKIYNSKPVLDVELSGFKIMETLMETFTEAAVYPDRFYSRQLINRVGSQYDINSPDLEMRIMAVIDYISGMTDVYALEIYQKIKGISLPIV
ncbi:dGTP triphosphohydrolase [Prevotella sp. OH937_COT-195]|uniref:dGTP triphosphohydrolase n=1 Tax=Prevotella sp. OH937_COT-195 TaxID=2491051 RepID=UPI000F6521C6|nr:dNTP triphosphohydrolase [Prevotella sp. OH937_COT-195]RRD00800.1 dNTP triphosphohydrolase [Prevotella sp. OH937_COT-195]